MRFMQNYNKTSDRQCLKLNDNKMLGKSYLNNFGGIVHALKVCGVFCW